MLQQATQYKHYEYSLDDANDSFPSTSDLLIWHQTCSHLMMLLVTIQLGDQGNL
jgi:hypothetical protein